MNMFEVMQLKGTYLATRYTQESVNKLSKWCQDQNVPKDRAQIDRLHTTILYSRKHIPGLPLIESVKQIEVMTSELDIWDTTDTKFAGNGPTRALILKLEAPALVEMHQRLMIEHNATHDYESYIPHMTLSYDVGNLSLKSFGLMPKMKLSLSFLYGQDLVL